VAYNWHACTISDANGSNPVQFWDANSPYPLPLPRQEYTIFPRRTRRSTTGPGRRVIQLVGTRPEDLDLEIEIPFVTPLQLAALNAKYTRLPAEPVQVTFDGAETNYLAVFQSQGIEAVNHTTGPDRKRLTIRLHVIEVLV